MCKRRLSNSKTVLIACGLILGSNAGRVAAQPSPKAVQAFNSYVASVETRIVQQHRSQTSILTPVTTHNKSDTGLRQGEMIVEKLTPAAGTDLPGALLHHWRGTAFAADAHTADFERLMKSISAYPQLFSPQVLEASILSRRGDHLQAKMRVRQKHVITVVMDTTYDIIFVRLDARHGYSLARSTRISEIDANGAGSGPALTPSEEHGYLWRMNTYWSYEERDGGLYMQVETVSLSRSIPAGLGWAVRPFVESVPRESLEFTLHSTCNALRK